MTTFIITKFCLGLKVMCPSLARNVMSDRYQGIGTLYFTHRLLYTAHAKMIYLTVIYNQSVGETETKNVIHTRPWYRRRI